MTRPWLAFAVLACAAGCLWRSYGTIMNVHLDVLTQTAAKLCAVVEAGRAPTAEAMAEYVYPAKRGREFLRQFERYRERPSYQEFSALLDRYEALIGAADAARTQGNWPEMLPRLSAERDDLDRRAARIRAMLKTES